MRTTVLTPKTLNHPPIWRKKNKMENYPIESGLTNKDNDLDPIEISELMMDMDESYRLAMKQIQENLNK